MNKRSLVKKILTELRAELESYSRAARSAQAEATHEQNRAENKYDTRGLEAAYLAGAQSRQAVETHNAIESFEKLSLREFGASESIDLSALVEVGTGRERSCFFVGPCKGGLEIKQNGKEVVVLTPQAPLGAELVGRKTGDSFLWGEGTAAVEYRILSVI